MQDLKDKIALVTGASAGIGAATARALAAVGARVVLCARRIERLEALAAELKGSRAVALDVRDPNRTAEIVEEFQPEIVVAGAGLALGVEKIHEGSIEDWNVVFDTNVKGVLNLVRAALPCMVGRGHGDIVLLGSVAGRQVYPGGNVYCASKFAVRALYEALRVDLCGSGIRFTTVDAGLVETEFSIVRFKGDRKSAGAVYQGLDPLRPEDVADAVLFALTRPSHVNIGEIVLWPTAQASTSLVARKKA